MADRTPPPFPWSQAMRFGLGVLRLSPNVFWAMTPRELAAAMTVFTDGAVNPPDKSTLGALMTAFPDRHPYHGEQISHG